MRCCNFLEASAVLTKCLPLVFLFAIEVLASASDSDISAKSVEQTRFRRAPGWGKRSYSDETGDMLDHLEESSQDLLKRAPGWGKRSENVEDVDELDEEKRAPGWGKRALGWGKRAPGWGKRAPGWGKRAPGWGKRAPGWGKRAPGWGKRAPGWGKRAPGWGKRAPGWGKRSADVLLDDSSFCESLEKKIDDYIYKAVEMDVQRLRDCGLEDMLTTPGGQ